MTDADRRHAGLRERLSKGPVLCAQGYLFELERRGYVQAGPFVPEVVLDHPEVVEQLHRDFVHAGSDVVEALTYYGHRAKMRVIEREADLETLNRQALAIAAKVARERGALLAGDICNTNAYCPGDGEAERRVRAMFEEQVGWAVDAGVDYIIAETFSYAGEALLALEAIRRARLPAVVTLAIHRRPITRDGYTPQATCKRLEDAGADVVGLNCQRGLWTMLPLLEPIRAALSGPLAALPVPYRTTEREPTFQSLRDPACTCLPSEMPFPVALDPFTCNRFEVAEFTRRARAAGVQYFGLCCGAMPHHVRSMAEALGRTPPASRYAPDMSRHAFFGTAETVSEANREYAKQM